jgi:adenosylcobinamide kinase/adenosylcobinamide-phosphate guanylyltransferase
VSGRILLVGGGVRSGKSDFGLARARALGPRRAFIATAQALDGEMAERIAEHARSRGDDFRTVEEPLELGACLGELADVDVVVVDCLTLWLSNLLLRDEPETAILARVDAVCALLARRRFHAVVVTNEVGMGIVPETALGRRFRDLSGRAHQRVARVSDEIYLAVLGTIVRVLPEPFPPGGDPP